MPSSTTWHTLLRFGVVGVLNTALDVAVFLLLVRVFNVHVAPANVMSYSLGLINSYVCNRWWTFGEVSQRLPVGRQFLLFAIFNLAGLALSTAMVASLQSLGATLAKLLSVPAVFVWNYATSRRFVYGK